MNIEINLLDVKNADAVLVHLAKEDNAQLVFVIDCGKANHHGRVLSALEQMLEKAGKKAPDFIMCTHYDNDHIGGMLALVKHYQIHKPTIWMHKTSEKVDIEAYKRSLMLAQNRDSILPSEKDAYLGGTMGQDQGYFEEAIRTVEQEIEAIRTIAQLEMQCLEPLAENFRIEGWPEISVISPSFEFYRQQFPDKFTAAELIEGQVQQLREQQQEEKAGAAAEQDAADPFLALDKVEKSKITPTNMNSAMLMIETHGKKFLFAADAGMAAFQQADQKKLADLYWLKVPHHGSRNNLDSHLIRLMKPKNAVISGGSLISPEIVACFEALGSKVSSTRDSGDIAFQENAAG